ncbi:MAG: MBL fold metallo-hydrolase [Candidatus Thorarchaeota archaeon]|jgi:glyoxylase-like metal-dependent hydrolase (beta-lactamase superfamily II)
MIEIPREIHRIEIPTPFDVGTMNAYLIEGDPIVLIDTGPKSEESLSALRKGFLRAGYTLEDVDRVLLTHGHVDHTGLSGTIVRENQQKGDSSTVVSIHEADSNRVVNYEEFTKQRVQSYIRIVEMAGVRTDERPLMPAGYLESYFLKFGESVPDVFLLEEGSSIKTSIGTLRTIWVPGHSTGSICFLCDDAKIVFSGDHILGTISSNPSLDFDIGDQISMMKYMKSLKRMDHLSGYTALPGHRDPITDLSVRVAELQSEYSSKLDKMRSFLSSQPRTLYWLSRKQFGDYNANSMVLALAETYDLLRILENDGEAIIEENDGIIEAISPK